MAKEVDIVKGLLEASGGVGLFLVGISLMTDGLKACAGNAIRANLARFTKGPLSGAVTGMITTALIQSSSATTVMAVGFVGAGLMTFPQSLGIVFGANVGTTMTGWMVAILGIKLSLGRIALPLILLGALLRMFGRGRPKAIGEAITGFGIVFFGFSVLQTGMQEFDAFVTPQSFPQNTFWGRTLLFAIGFLITLITQSSSAGVATVVTGLHAGHITLDQGAALVVGMDVGTTATALLASVGGNVNARRTGVAHLVFNVLTGVVAFVMVPFYVQAWNSLAVDSLKGDPELALVAFHSLLNLVGVCCVLPFATRFANFIVWLVPAGNRILDRALEPSLLTEPRIALESAHATLERIAQVVFLELDHLLQSQVSPSAFLNALQEAQDATRNTSYYLDQIHAPESDLVACQQKIASYHVVDHLSRLITRAGKEDRLKAVLRDPELLRLGERLTAAIAMVNQQGFTMDTAKVIEGIWLEMEQVAEPYRRETIERTIRKGTSLEATLNRMDGIRWLKRIAYHAWRIAYHMRRSSEPGRSNASASAMRSESDPGDE
jgi:phosphate:Na+ symporter